ncbi:MAG: uracil-DNA glycosylase [Candidatus Krumholzibacteria bacterium]|nr:uracil-DNA glycosylase [Candidatus Krumholzibacteria bacterium]
MKTADGRIRDAMRRYLISRGALAGGVLYRARGPLPRGEAPDGTGSRAPAMPAAGAGDPGEPAAPGVRPAATGTVVRTSPAGPRGAACAHGAQDRAGFTRDTRSSLQAGLFEPGAAAPPDLSALDLEGLRAEVARCTRCPLSATRTTTVFGDGDPRSRIVFIGEAPGREEDLQGVPFVGRAGKLLDKMLAAVGFDRSGVYIANILKCRPPGNRDPNEEETAACEPYLARQLELIEPAVICALGRVAGQALLGAGAPLKTLREGTHRYNGIRVMVTYHPAALLRNPNLKRDAWEDMKALRKVYDGTA